MASSSASPAPASREWFAAQRDSRLTPQGNSIRRRPSAKGTRGRQPLAVEPVATQRQLHAQDRPHQLPGRHQRDGTADQPPHRAEPRAATPAAVARRPRAPLGPPAQHRLRHRRATDRRGVGHRGRRRVGRRAAAARACCTSTSNAPGFSASISGRRPRRRARRDRRAVPDADHVCDARRPVRLRGRARAHRPQPSARRTRTWSTRAWASACPGRIDASGTTRVRAEPRVERRRSPPAARVGARPAGGRGERRQRLRPGRAVVRAASRSRARPRGGHRVGGHRRRHADQRTAGARRQCDGRRVRSRDDRSRGPGVPVRSTRVLGTLRVELRRGAVLRRGPARHPR